MEDFNQHFLTWQEYEYEMKALILNRAVLGFQDPQKSLERLEDVTVNVGTLVLQFW